MLSLKKINVKTIFNLSVIIFSLGALTFFCIYENGVTGLIEVFSKINFTWILIAILCNFMNIMFDGYLIYIITKRTYGDYKFKNAFKSCMVGQFFSAVTPFATGGQPMQIYLMSKQGISPGISTSVLMQKFLVYQTTLVTYSAVSIFVLFKFLGRTVNKIIIGFAVFGFLSQAFIIFLLLLFSFNSKITHSILIFGANCLTKLHIIKDTDKSIKPIEDQLLRFHESNNELSKDVNILIKAYIVTFFQLTSMFIVPYFIYRSFNLSGARCVKMIFSQAFVTMTSCFIPLPGAAGAAEVSFLGFFSMFFTPEIIKSAVLIWRIITYYLVILVSAPFSRLAKE